MNLNHAHVFTLCVLQVIQDQLQFQQQASHQQQAAEGSGNQVNFILTRHSTLGSHSMLPGIIDD